MSDDPEQEYFSDGISEDIITDLSKVSALSVVARNTAFTFKGKRVDVKEVARELNVSHVLEGSVRKAGNRVRITAQLIDGAAGDHVWAERYDRDLDDIFALQDEISKAIVEALKLKLLPEEKKAIEQRGTTNAEAYNLYLMARQQWIGGNFGDLRRDEAIVRVCKQAVELDPDYAQAWALMALAQAELRFCPRQGRERAAGGRTRAGAQSRPSRSALHQGALSRGTGQPEEAEQQIRTALKVDPEFVGGQSRSGADAVPPGPHREAHSVLRKGRRADGHGLAQSADADLLLQSPRRGRECATRRDDARAGRARHRARIRRTARRSLSAPNALADRWASRIVPATGPAAPCCSIQTICYALQFRLRARARLDDADEVRSRP